MNKYLKIASPWSQLATFLMLLGASWLVTLLVGAGILLARLGISGFHPGLDLSDPALTPTLKLTQAVATITMFGIPAFFYAWRTFADRPLHFLGFRPAPSPIFYGLAVALLLFSFPFGGWLGELNKGIPLPNWMMNMEKDAGKQITVFLRADSTMDIVINVFIIAVLPAVFEEACFRGALQRILIQIFKNPWAGIVTSAIFFSAFHMQFQGFFPRMFLGILLGAIYWYSGSLWASILAHFFTNGTQVIAVSLYPKLIKEDPSVPIYAALISLLIVVGLLAVLRRRSEVRYEDVYRQADEYDGFPG